MMLCNNCDEPLTQKRIAAIRAHGLAVLCINCAESQHEPLVMIADLEGEERIVRATRWQPPADFMEVR